MDPKANIAEQREIARRMVDGDYSDDAVDLNAYDDDASRLAELVLALDEWRSKGGSDPYGFVPEVQS